MKRKSVYLLNNLNEEHLGGGARAEYPRPNGERKQSFTSVQRVLRVQVRGGIAAKQLGSGATHVALCDNIGLYFIHLCKVLAARFLDAKMPRGIDA